MSEDDQRTAIGKRDDAKEMMQDAVVEILHPHTKRVRDGETMHRRAMISDPAEKGRNLLRPYAEDACGDQPRMAVPAAR